MDPSNGMNASLGTRVGGPDTLSLGLLTIVRVLAWCGTIRVAPALRRCWPSPGLVWMDAPRPWTSNFVAVSKRSKGQCQRNIERPDPRSLVSKPETGQYLSTFTCRLPFVLAFEADFGHDLGIPGEYVNEADAAVFGGAPFVRVRLFNAPVADRTFGAANLAVAVDHFYGAPVPHGEVDGKHLYEQWVTLETPAVFLSDEPAWDPAFAFHRSMAALNRFLEAFAIARGKDWVRPVSIRELRPTVAIGRLDLDGNWTAQGPMLIHPDAKPSPLGSRLLEQHVEQLNQALGLILAEAPFLRAGQWRARAERRKYEGDAADAIISYQVAAEVTLFELWGLLLLEEGVPAQDVAERREEQAFKTLLSVELGPRLGGSWDLTLERKPVGRYWADLYTLRNRIAHGGYQPTDGDAERAESAYEGLERFVDERLRARRKRYPASLIAKLGEGDEVLLARLDAEGQAEAAGRLGVLLQSRGDSTGAEAAFRRSRDRGSLEASVSLGKLLIDKGDRTGAEAAWRHADLGGSAAGAANLGRFLYVELGDIKGAEAAWRRADDRGSIEGAMNLGVILAERGDAAGAEEAWQRADARGSAEAAVNLGNILEERGEHDAAEAAWQRADERGSADGAFGVGLKARQRGDVDGARAAFRRADERGSAEGAVSLGRIMEQEGELSLAEELYARAEERGNLEGAFNLGVLLYKNGRLEEAEGAYARAAAGGLEKAIFNLGGVYFERGAKAEAAAAFRRIVDSDDVELNKRARNALAKCEH